MIGKRLNHYEILRKLGSGGMGDVYVAQDEKLGREVALKVLPPELATNPDARTRFAREAKAVAALNHPGIVTLFSIEDADGVHFTTMEVVNGKTLAELIEKKGLTLEQLFDIAIPLADAVSTAHQQGITHRDLKPQNVMVTDEGRVKVLDFGLAKLRDEIPGKAMTQLHGTVATEEGRILGTVAYMSPEQAQGKEVDPRTDIFALGVLLYEMATGERPFKGDTGVSILSSILKDTPTPVTDLNHRLPRHLGRIVKHCLQKDPGRRYQSTIDLRNDLEELKEEVDSGALQAPAAGLGPTRKNNRLLLAGGAALLVAAAFLAAELIGPDESGTPADALRVSLKKLTSQPGEKLFPTLSPDGKTVAYAWRVDDNWDIYLQRVGGDNPINLSRHEAEDSQPAFSPDGEKIAFRSGRDGGGIFVMGATGESVRRLTDFGFNPAWSGDGSKIVFGRHIGVSGAMKTSTATFSELWTVDVGNGETKRIYDGDVIQPHWSPHGHRVAYWGLHRGGQRDIWTIPAQGGEPVPVTDQESIDWNPVWAPDGRHLYFFSDRGGSENLWRVPIDERSGKPSGRPEEITRGGSASRRHVTLAAGGRHIAFAEQIGDSHLWRIELRLDDPRPELEAVTTGSLHVHQGQVSPDGERLAFIVWGPRQRDLFVSRADGQERRQLTDDIHKEWRPGWSPDGEQIAFKSDRGGEYDVWVIQADGSGLRQLTETPAGAGRPTWSPDGLRIIYTDPDSRSAAICDANASRAQGEPLPLFSERVWISSWSPDGRWLAGSVEDSGIVVFSLESRKYEKVAEVGDEPVWLSDSRRLVFPHKRKIMLLDVESRELQEIAEIDGDISSISVTKDDRWIYFRRFKAQADIWLATLE